MVEPVTVLTFEPAPPLREQIDGLLFTVTGPVRPTGKVILKRDTDNKIVDASPEFGMKNTPGEGNEVVTLGHTGTPTAGTFTLTGVAEAVQPSETETGPHGPLPTTAPIPYNATAAQIAAALNLAWGTTGVTATGGPIQTTNVVLTFAGDLGSRQITLSVANTVTGGTVTTTETTPGGAPQNLPGGPYLWGPIYLFDGNYHADVVQASGVNEGVSLLGATVAVVVPAS